MPEAFDYISDRSPEVLLKSDVGALDDSAREHLVASILAAFGNGRLFDSIGLTRQLSRLAHPRLADQLLPYLSERSRSLASREVAVDIAEECGVRELQGQLVAIALNPREADHLRVNASLAVARIADPWAKLALRPILTGEIEGDKEGELKGAALQTLWPNYIGLDEALEAAIHGQKSLPKPVFDVDPLEGEFTVEAES